jgi:heptosyltransferase-2
VEVLLENSKESDLHLYFSPKKFSKETLGINAGATYGSAKRWYPERFAKVIENLSSRYETILFGGKGEIDINRDIENILKERRVSNFTNLAGKTSIQELAENIGGLSLFITNDSGPMHIAGAYKIPTITIFGSTNHTETDQWKNEKSFIVRKEMECSPCMKRECPLKHHNCMKEIYPEDILKVISEFKL